MRTLDASHQHENENDDENDAENAGWEIAEAARIAPCGQGADQQQNKDDNENGAEHRETLLFDSLLTLACNAALEQRKQQGGGSEQDQRRRQQRHDELGIAGLVVIGVEPQ